MDDPSMGEPFSPRKPKQQHLSPFICPCGKDHTPKRADKRRYIGYWMFEAASQGCKPCVQHCIEQKGIDPGVRSWRQNYTAMSWAIWGREQQVEGTEEVVAYLASKRPRYSDGEDVMGNSLLS